MIDERVVQDEVSAAGTSVSVPMSSIQSVKCITNKVLYEQTVETVQTMIEIMDDSAGEDQERLNVSLIKEAVVTELMET